MLLDRPDPRRLDAALAVAVLVAVQAGVWFADDVPGGRPLSALTLTVASAALIWRRSHPVAVLLVVVAGDLLPSLVAWRSTDTGTSFVVLLAAVYSLGRHAPPRRAVAALVVPIASTVVQTVLGDPETFDDATWQTTTVIIAALIGYAMRAGSQREGALHERTRRLAADRERRAHAAVAEERARIARELHDVVAHNVSVITLQAGAALELLQRDPQQARAPLESIEATSREALGELRRLLGVLRGADADAPLTPQPSIGALPALVEQVCRSGLPVELELRGDANVVEPGLGLSAYRIVQEALTNVIKHAGTTRVRVLVACGPDAVDIEVVDDGGGNGHRPAAGAGQGLVGMRERVALYGGELAAGPRPEGGFAVRARLGGPAAEVPAR